MLRLLLCSLLAASPESPPPVELETLLSEVATRAPRLAAFREPWMNQELRSLLNQQLGALLPMKEGP